MSHVLKSLKIRSMHTKHMQDMEEDGDRLIRCPDFGVLYGMSA